MYHEPNMTIPISNAIFDFKVDIDNYIIYQESQIYFNNHDWPGNNIKYWKHKGGKWKWII